MQYFSTGAAEYAVYRPTYPLALIEALEDISPATDCALDCGCGTGQLSVLLADRFSKVIATDASTEQINHAQPHPQVSYRTAPAENSGLEAASVDLITVAQAAHWLDLPRFYAEAWRIAKPRAVIALITYGALHVEGEINHFIQEFYHQTIAPYWPAERRHVDEGYRNLLFPFQEIALPAFIIEVMWSLDELVGYINTWSAVKLAAQILGYNPVERLIPQLNPYWGEGSTRKKITWPLTIRAGRI